MKVTLAGFNVEAELLKQLGKGKRQPLTPEVISAAYARISRSDKPVDELRQEAREELESARRSNTTIVFKMGHHSIAEHAVFNLDVAGISRLCAEVVEHHRLNSYTEKSQRYVTGDDRFVVPAEIAGSDFADDFVRLVKEQNTFYHELYAKLVNHFQAKHPEWREEPTRLENRAKEDARYILSLATETQLGLTANARNLELVIRHLAAAEPAEMRALAEELYQQVVAVAPSLILFQQPTDYERATYPRMREFAQTFMVSAFPRRPKNFIAMSASDVILVDYTQNADNKLLAALMHAVSRASFAECVGRVERQTLARKKEILKLAMQDLQAYDAVLREFEHLSLTFELVISASCFAQLKRHRLMSLTAQPYSPNQGWTIPVSIAEVKEHKTFKEILGRTEDLFDRLSTPHPAAAQYVLTNSHQRRVVVTVNARELYHVARLREDAEAQWDIRDIASKMVDQARHVMPLTLTLACGKDVYPKVYEDLFGRPPAVTKLELPKARPLDETKEPPVPVRTPARRSRPAAKLTILPADDHAAPAAEAHEPAPPATEGANP